VTYLRCPRTFWLGLLPYGASKRPRRILSADCVRSQRDHEKQTLLPSPASDWLLSKDPLNNLITPNCAFPSATPSITVKIQHGVSAEIKDILRRSRGGSSKLRHGLRRVRSAPPEKAQAQPDLGRRDHFGGRASYHQLAALGQILYVKRPPQSGPCMP